MALEVPLAISPIDMDYLLPHLRRYMAFRREAQRWVGVCIGTAFHFRDGSGVATTIGMGLMSMSYGISKVLHVEVTNTLLVILMLVLVRLLHGFSRQRCGTRGQTLKRPQYSSLYCP